MPVQIELTQGRVAFVDEADMPMVSQFKWHFHEGREWRPHYARTNKPDGSMPYLHIFLVDPPKGFQVDHIDRDGLNCVRKNMRTATHSQNGANRRRKPNAITGFRGVYPRPLADGTPRYIALIRVDSTIRCLGTYEDAETAAHVYDDAAREAFGEFATLNFPGGSS